MSQSFGEGAQDPYGMYAGMAAGAPVWQNPVNWIKGQVTDLYNNVYDWASDNVSRAPIGIFSILASAAPTAIGGVKFNIPTGVDKDVLGIMSGSQWSGGTITYSLPDSRSDYQLINPSAGGYRPLTFETEQAVRYALEGYSPYAGGPKMGLSSVEGVTALSLDYAGRNGGTLQVSGFDAGSMINRSHGYYPGVPIYGGDVWLELNSGKPGTYSYMVVLHELGHSLGLKHSHDSGGYLPAMSKLHDSPEYTVMSYTSMWDNPQTYMQYDIAALQEMYGADFATNSTNTVYKWSPETGEAFVNGVGQGAPVTNKIFMTIWDGGGNDTYDVSNYSENALIDLSPGGFIKFSQAQLGIKTSTSYVNGNVYNAFQYHGDPRSLIENAVAGSGNDTIKGNTGDNVLTGNAGNDGITGAAGNDTLLGGDGNDWLDGGVGRDLMNGGDGWDMVSYVGTSSSLGGVTVDLTTNQNSGAAAGDYLMDIEALQGTNAGDVLIGVYRGNGNGAELYGEAGNDYLTGKAGGDRLYGGAGNDWLDGGAAGDLLDGGAGWDMVSYSGMSSGVVVNMTTNQNGGAAAGDTLVGIEVVQGTNAGDTITGIDFGSGNGVQLHGEGGNDVLTGKGGGDYLYGGAGNDTLDGAGGSNVLWGGAGRDLFRVTSSGGTTTIGDFTSDEQIALYGSPFADFTSVRAAAVQSGSDVVIAKNGFHLVLNSFTVSSLAADDFAFV
ncbi:M10 family metallopeptidase [Microvirga rosea]|uniref:M10 family metallopeptidase n=1 Tax=Microvirga rosea TaxID=2715425 RepID=UPI001D0AE9E2|nr:M10 family metallopeptidase [Microvirga rosea]MCB8820637.1 M10 family metallopeptidase C-terminal domain-containing protein [Microvirga rosea]